VLCARALQARLAHSSNSSEALADLAYPSSVELAEIRRGPTVRPLPSDHEVLTYPTIRDVSDTLRHRPASSELRQVGSPSNRTPSGRNKRSAVILSRRFAEMTRRGGAALEGDVLERILAAYTTPVPSQGDRPPPAVRLAPPASPASPTDARASDEPPSIGDETPASDAPLAKLREEHLTPVLSGRPRAIARASVNLANDPPKAAAPALYFPQLFRDKTPAIDAVSARLRKVHRAPVPPKGVRMTPRASVKLANGPPKAAIPALRNLPTLLPQLRNLPPPAPEPQISPVDRPSLRLVHLLTKVELPSGKTSSAVTLATAGGSSNLAGQHADHYGRPGWTAQPLPGDGEILAYPSKSDPNVFRHIPAWSEKRRVRLNLRGNIKRKNDNLAALLSTRFAEMAQRGGASVEGALLERILATYTAASQNPLHAIPIAPPTAVRTSRVAPPMPMPPKAGSKLGKMAGPCDPTKGVQQRLPHRLPPVALRAPERPLPLESAVARDTDKTPSVRRLPPVALRAPGLPPPLGLSAAGDADKTPSARPRALEASSPAQEPVYDALQQSPSSATARPTMAEAASEPMTARVSTPLPWARSKLFFPDPVPLAATRNTTASSTGPSPSRPLGGFGRTPPNQSPPAAPLRIDPNRPAWRLPFAGPARPSASTAPPTAFQTRSPGAGLLSGSLASQLALKAEPWRR